MARNYIELVKKAGSDSWELKPGFTSSSSGNSAGSRSASVKEGEFTMQSRIRDIYRTPVGHDILDKMMLTFGIPAQTLDNPLVGSWKLSGLQKIAGRKLEPAFFDVFLKLVNQERELPGDERSAIVPAWWKEAVFYQIYPRTFYDTDGDGIGDLKGILQKLDYLKELGVDALWLSPVYDSPNDDNGYDIRDYHKIMAEFGTMEDFDELLEQVHARGMRLIMDLVVNHTSDEHEWFQEALRDPESPKRGYYFFREGEEDNLPNNWMSFFSGPAWNYYPEQKQYALHLFSGKQMDLNWDNPELRKAVIAMINWWLDKGVDGFRMDVINYISKEDGLPDGDETVGKLLNFPGVEQYFYGPHLHEYLHQIHEEAFEPHGAFSVGETPGVGMEMAKLLTGDDRGELDMIFSFDHLESPGKTRYDVYRYDLNYYRDYITDWMNNYGNRCWMSLFYNNHDNPRMAGKINPDPAYRRQIQILLAVMQFTLKGTPFVYQGDEMGITNYHFSSIDEIRDIEAHGIYGRIMEERGKTPEEAMQMINAGTREHGRILLPWNEVPEGSIAAQQTADEMITRVYRTLIALRKNYPALIYGEFEKMNSSKNRFIYRRRDERNEFVIECNLSPVRRKALFPGTGYVPVFGDAGQMLEAYDARIWKKL